MYPVAILSRTFASLPFFVVFAIHISSRSIPAHVINFILPCIFSHHYHVIRTARSLVIENDNNSSLSILRFHGTFLGVYEQDHLCGI